MKEHIASDVEYVVFDSDTVMTGGGDDTRGNVRADVTPPDWP